MENPENKKKLDKKEDSTTEYSDELYNKLFKVDQLSPTNKYDDEKLNSLTQLSHDQERKEGETIEDYIKRIDKLSNKELLLIENKKTDGNKKVKRSKSRRVKRRKSKRVKRSKSKRVKRSQKKNNK